MNAAAADGRWIYTLFSGTDEKWHNKLRRPINWIFTPSAAASYEPIVDKSIMILLQEIRRRCRDQDSPDDGILDLSQWFLYYAFDVMGDLTYNRRFGFLESGRDMEDMISYVQNFLSYGFYVSLRFYNYFAVGSLIQSAGCA